MTSNQPAVNPQTNKWTSRFLGLAEFVSGWSKDPSTKVGAVIVGENKAVISVGFNGFAASMPDDEELYANRDEKYSRIIHAEINALLFTGRPIPPGSTLYTWPVIPCDRCVVQMIQAGIKKFVAPKPTEDMNSRWGKALEKTRKYVKECGGELYET